MSNVMAEMTVKLISPSQVEPPVILITGDQSGLIAGTYCVTVTDANGCTIEDCFTVNEPPALNLSGTVTDVKCNGGKDGQIDITVTGGTPGYTYNWDIPSSNEDQSGLIAGTYCVTVTDANGCTIEDCFTVNEPPALNLSGTVTDVKCNSGNDGQIDITVVGGTPGYTFNWGNGNTNEDLSNIQAGVYCVTVTDANGCTVEDCFTVDEPPALNLSGSVTDVKCNGGNDGEIDITVTGGTPGYSYNWDIPSSDEDQSGLIAGTYCVTVTDANGCAIDDCFTIHEPPALNLSGSVTDVKCNGGKDGEIEVSVSGGTPGYTYSWDIPSSDEDQSGLSAGIYCLTVTDANGCIVEDCFTVNEPPALNLSGTVTDVKCNGGNDGTIDITVTGGTPGYSHSWDIPSSDEDQSGLIAGTYCVTVTDANGCYVEDCFTVNEPEVLQLTGRVSDIKCNGENDGSIDITVTGGTPGYSYSWDIPSSNEDQSGLSEGTYCVTVTDANGCYVEDCYTIEESDKIELTAIVNDVKCNGGNDGSIDISVTGGTPAYTYNWDSPSSEEDQSGLIAGTYCVTVTDANGCAIEDCFKIREPDELNLTGVTSNVLCNGENQGSIDISVTGGTPGYSYSWDIPSSDEDQSGLIAGTYCVTVTDANGCTVADCFEIEEPRELIISNSKVFDIKCYGDTDGFIEVTVSGGTPGYNYQWNDPTLDNSPNQSGLGAGTYCVTITDTNGCTIDECFEIEGPDKLFLRISKEDIVCHGDKGSIDLEVSGGNTPYNFIWNNGLPSTEDQYNLDAGTYCVVVTDQKGCSIDTCISILKIDELELEVEVEDVRCNGEFNGRVDLTVHGGTAPYSYSWDFGSTNEDLLGLGAGSYCVTVTDANGCQIDECIEVNEPKQLQANLLLRDPTCGKDNGSAELQVNGGNGNYSYNWSRNNSNSNTISDLASGPISVTITDEKGCSIVKSGELDESTELVCQARVVSQISSRNGNDGIITVDVSGGDPSYSYSWDINGSIENGQTVDNLSAGTYYVTIEDQSGCQCTSELTLINPAKIGDFVWEDLNGNGLQDIGENGIEGIEVILSGTNIFGNAVNASSLTDGNGIYMFDGLMPGDYSVQFDAPQSYTFTSADQGSDDIDSDANTINGTVPTFTLNEGEYNDDIDAGLLKSVNIGDYVWFDDNQNGIQDINEDGIEGFNVRLIQSGQDGIFGTADDVVVLTTTTDANGNYLFMNVLPGVYRVIFDAGSLPNNTMFTFADIGNDDEDSDVLGMDGSTNSFTIISGQSDKLDIDAGIKDNCTEIRDGGEIDGAEQGCSPSFNGSEIVSVSAPGNLQYEYEWYESFVNVPFDIFSPEWRKVPNETGESYDPGRVVYSTYYVRVARVLGCENTAWAPSNIVFKELIRCDTDCDNVISAGLIGFSEIKCGPFDPDEIVNVQFPSGGSAGVIEYLWMMSTDDPHTPNTIWIPIQNSNTPNYNPGPITETTNFMRCARREDCTNYIETNIVVKRILDGPVANIENVPQTYCVDDQVIFVATQEEVINDYDWTFEGANVNNASGPEVNITWTSAGIHSVQLTTTDRFGCTNTEIREVSVSNDPQDCPNMMMAVTLSATLNTNGEVELHYDAVTEMPNVEFVIEKSDDNEFQYDQLNRLAETMPTGHLQSFETMDAVPAYGYNYYRVRMSNSYGTEVTSNTVQVLIQEDNVDIFLYPNPLVQSDLTIGAINNFHDGTIIEIINTEGQVLSIREAVSNDYKKVIDASEWPEGTYFVRITAKGDRPTIMKFVKFDL
jgi:hypothetical protein